MGKRKIIAVIDTETAPVRPSKYVNAHNMRTYDIGYQIRAKYDGEIFCERSFVISDVFDNEKMMNTAYYAEKIPSYKSDIAEGLRDVKSMGEVYQIFAQDCREFGITEVWAYNANFDRIALNVSAAEYSKGFVSDFISATGAEWRDIWSFAQVITGSSRYGEWATEHGYVTETGTPKTSAEHVYRFLTRNKNFTESHTALEDVRIESSILTACIARKRKDPKQWRGNMAAARWAKSKGRYVGK